MLLSDIEASTVLPHRLGTDRVRLCARSRRPASRATSGCVTALAGGAGFRMAADVAQLAALRSFQRTGALPDAATSDNRQLVVRVWTRLGGARPACESAAPAQPTNPSSRRR